MDLRKFCVLSLLIGSSCFEADAFLTPLLRHTLLATPPSLSSSSTAPLFYGPNNNQNEESARAVTKSKRKKKKKGTPRSKAKKFYSPRNNNHGTVSSLSDNTTTRTSAPSQRSPARPPPLLADYASNCASNRPNQVLRRSDDRIGTTCEHYQECSGCTVGVNVAHTPVVQAAQRFFANDSYDGTSSSANAASDRDGNNEDSSSYPVVIPSPVTGWRTQAKLAVANRSSSSWKNDGCVFGLYERGSHQLHPIPDCLVHHPSINRAVARLEEATRQAGVAAYNTQQQQSSSSSSGDGVLRYVQLQVERVTGRVCLTLVWNAATLKECQPALARLLKALNNNSSEDKENNNSLWHSIWCHCNDGAGNNIFSRNPGRWHRLQGPEFLREPMAVAASAEDDSQVASAGTAAAAGWLYFTPLTFRQGNLDGFDILALDVARAVPPGSKVCELYGGVGILGLTALAYHHNNNHPLPWLRCSDENPSNPRCFQRTVDSLPEAMTGRNRSRNKYNKHNRRPYQKQQDDYNNNNNNSEGMTLGELAALMDSGKPVPEFRSKQDELMEKTSYLIASAGKALRLGEALGAQVLIVDPPRRGLEDEVLDELCKPYDPDQPYVESATILTIPDESVNWTNDVQTLIYVSCGFDALARDCDRLLFSNAGWRLQSSTGYLLFPGSDHIETLAIFQRK